MNENMIVSPPLGGGGNGVYEWDLTFYFLEGGRVNTTGVNYNYIWYRYIELRDKNNNKITLDNSQFSASSVYSNYPVSNLNILNTIGWSTARGNNGNPNKSCWFKISGINREVFQIDLIGNTSGISRLISVEADGIEIARVDRTHLTTNLYPLAGDKYPTLSDRPICEIIL